MKSLTTGSVDSHCLIKHTFVVKKCDVKDKVGGTQSSKNQLSNLSEREMFIHRHFQTLMYDHQLNG